MAIFQGERKMKAMKKLCAILISMAVLLTLASISASAQGITDKGVKVGLNMSTLSSNFDIDFKSKLGFIAGGFLTFGLPGGLAFQPELLYSNKGAKYEERFDGDVAKLWIILNYLEMPLLVKYGFPMSGGSQLTPSIYGGPYGAYRLSGKSKIEFDGQTQTEDINSDEMKTIDYGLVFGAGLDFPMGRGKITFDLRYSLGLANLAKNQVGEDEVTKNRSFQAMIGYGF